MNANGVYFYLRDTLAIHIYFRIFCDSINYFIRMLHLFVSLMAQHMLPLPEITQEEFRQAWARFKLAAGMNEAKQLTIVPALLRGKAR